MKEDIAKALESIEKSSSIAIISHDRPDGDAIGSVVGLGLMLEELGKKVFLLNHDKVPPALRFLPESERVADISNPPPEIGTSDLILALDSAGKDRINDRVWKVLPPDCPIVNIDHHVSNTGFGDINVVYPDSPATGEIIYELAQGGGWQLSKASADNLFAAISTDTGSFRYPNTTAKTYRAAAGLIEAGVNVGEINQQLYESYPLRRVECIRDLLQRMKISFEGRCASVSLSLDLKRKLQLEAGDTEGVVDIIRAIDTVVVAVFFEEMEGGRIRVSSRSKDKSVNVSQICEQFGGGGHHLAAGARLAGPLEEAEQKFLGAIAETLGRLN